MVLCSHGKKKNMQLLLCFHINSRASGYRQTIPTSLYLLLYGTSLIFCSADSTSSTGNLPEKDEFDADLIWVQIYSIESKVVQKKKNKKKIMKERLAPFFIF